MCGQMVDGSLLLTWVGADWSVTLKKKKHMKATLNGGAMVVERKRSVFVVRTAGAGTHLPPHEPDERAAYFKRESVWEVVARGLICVNAKVQEPGAV